MTIRLRGLSEALGQNKALMGTRDSWAASSAPLKDVARSSAYTVDVHLQQPARQHHSEQIDCGFLLKGVRSVNVETERDGGSRLLAEHDRPFRRCAVIIKQRQPEQT